MRFGIDRAAFFPIRDTLHKRTAEAIVSNYITHAKPYHEFETAISGRLLANHIPIFEYEGA